MSRKPKNVEEPFSPEQLERLENKGDKQVQMQRHKEGIFQRYHAKRDAKDIAKQVVWKRRAGVALIVMVLVLLLLWIISWLMVTIGDLVITVDSGAAKKGISISESADGGDGATFKLSANMVNEVTNITYDWLPATLDLEADGSHNGKNYLAYTFYLTNNGKETLNYQSELQSVRAAKDADEACRVMIYKNGEPEVFAKENRTTDDSGNPLPFEKIFKKVIPDNYTPPAELPDPETQVQSKELVDTTDEEIVIQPFIDSKTVFNTSYEGLEPGQTDKYTIVMWIEGEDPECLDVIRDGYVKLMWFFNVEDEEL